MSLYKKLILTGFMAFSLFASNGGVVFAENIFTNEDFLPNKLRRQLEKKGISFEAVYTAEYFANTQGGIKRDDTYLTNLDITLEIDTKKLGLWEKWTVLSI